MPQHTTHPPTHPPTYSPLPQDNFYAIFLHGQVAYHDFEGVTVRMGERERLVANLGRWVKEALSLPPPQPIHHPPTHLNPQKGEKNVLILRNHGLLVAGASVAHAFFYYYSLHRACEIQCAASVLPGVRT